MNGRKEWVRFAHSPTMTTITVTLQEGNVTAKYTAKTYLSAIKGGVTEARAGADQALTELQEALS